MPSEIIGKVIPPCEAQYTNKSTRETVREKAWCCPGLGDGDGGAVEAASLEVGQGAVGRVERVLVRKLGEAFVHGICAASHAACFSNGMVEWSS